MVKRHNLAYTSKNSQNKILTYGCHWSENKRNRKIELARVEHNILRRVCDCEKYKTEIRRSDLIPILFKDGMREMRGYVHRNIINEGQTHGTCEIS